MGKENVANDAYWAIREAVGLLQDAQGLFPAEGQPVPTTRITRRIRRVRGKLAEVIYGLEVKYREEEK